MLDEHTLKELVECRCLARYSRDEHASLLEEAGRLGEARHYLAVSTARAAEMTSRLSGIGRVGRALGSLLGLGLCDPCERPPGERSQGSLMEGLAEAEDRQAEEAVRLEKLAGRLRGAVESDHGVLVLDERGNQLMEDLLRASARLGGMTLAEFVRDRREREDRIGESLGRFLSAFGALGEEGRDPDCIEAAIAISRGERPVDENLRSYRSVIDELRASRVPGHAAREIGRALCARSSDELAMARRIAGLVAGGAAPGAESWRVACKLLDVPGRTLSERLRSVRTLAAAIFGERAADRFLRDDEVLAPAAAAAALGMPSEPAMAVYEDVSRSIEASGGCAAISRGLSSRASAGERAHATRCVVELMAGCRPPHTIPAAELPARFLEALDCLERYGMSRSEEEAPLFAARIARIPGAVAEHAEDLESIFRQIYEMDMYVERMSEISLAVLESALTRSARR